MRVTPNWALRGIEAGFVSFAATSGALLTFARGRGGMLTPFARIGRRVALDVALPFWGDSLLGALVHLGQCLALGVFAVLLSGALGTASRLRAALLTVVCWQAASLIPWLAVIRADGAVDLSKWARLGLAVLLVGALTVGGRESGAVHAANGKLQE